MQGQIEKFLEDRQTDMVDVLRQLVQIPTINLPGENFCECATFLNTRLQELGFSSAIHKVPQQELQAALPDCADFPRYNVYGLWDVGAQKTVHFNAHYDVVPVSDGWRFPPFSATIDKNVIYGRGTADMKGAIAALLHAVSAFMSTGRIPKMNVEISFVCDEEIGGELGSNFVVRRGLPKADFAVVCEGASRNQVGVGHNGVIWLEVRFSGRSAHASRPQEGVNAFVQMAALVQELESFAQDRSGHTFQLSDGREMSPTLTLGGTFGQGGGAKTNIVPRDAWFTLDRRVLPNEDHEAVERDLRASIGRICQSFSNSDVEIITIHSAGSFHTPESGNLPKALAHAVQSVHQGPVQYHVTPGFTDARFFGQDLGVPTVGYGTGGANFHGVDEHLALDDLLATSKVYASFMARDIPS